MDVMRVAGALMTAGLCIVLVVCAIGLLVKGALGATGDAPFAAVAVVSTILLGCAVSAGLVGWTLLRSNRRKKS
jgi:nitrate reductase gamma subunit